MTVPPERPGDFSAYRNSLASTTIWLNYLGARTPLKVVLVPLKVYTGTPAV
jgi:hypothetical protein